MSSIYFHGDSTSYLSIPTDISLNDIDFRTEDFTIEWFQYQLDENPFPRIFQIGSYNTTITIGVSIEGGSFYYWVNSSPNYVIGLNTSDYKNKWVHFAICRSSGVTQIYMDGVSIFSMSDTNDYLSGGSPLIISNESSLTNDAAFGGYMYYLHWVKGLAKYTSNFTLSYSIPTVLPETVLLLTSTGFLGTSGNTVVNNADVYSIAPIEPTPTPPNVNKVVQSLFTDNARVYYKKGSLASCGVGSVRNSSVKSRKI